jgi:hypothetical protein
VRVIWDTALLMFDKSMDLLFFRGIINFKTINTFLKQRFDEKEKFALLEHL